MKKKIIATLLTLTTLLSAAPVFAYPDCTDENVMALTELGILDGDENGNFNPHQNLTRAEFSKMIAPALNGYEHLGELNFVRDEVLFNDIENHWGFKYIVFCQKNGLIDGFEDDTFRPDESLTYSQTIKMCLSAIGYSGLEKDTEPWHEKWTAMAYEYGLTETKIINPNEYINRIDAAKLVYKTINMPLCTIDGYTQIETEEGPVWGPTFKMMDGTSGEFQSIYTTRFAKKTEE